MTKKILLIEDDLIIHHVVKEFTKDENYSIDFATNGKDAMIKIEGFKYDLILLDLILPDITGEDLIEFIKTNSSAPIFIITSKNDEMTLALCLAMGAEEYMTKPFSKIEFLARIKLVFRQEKKKMIRQDQINEIGPYIINYNTYECFKDGVNIRLTAKEFQILAFLLSDIKKVFSKKEIYFEIWNDQQYFNENLINVHVRRLRKKLQSEKDHQPLIITVFGFGYRINETLRAK